MVYKRYIYKNGKKIGPYYYESKKVDGKVISTYLGTSPPKKIFRGFRLPKNTLKFAIIFLSAIIIVLLVNLIFNLHLFSTGNPIQSLEKSEGITGTILDTGSSDSNKTNFTGQEIPAPEENIVPITEPPIQKPIIETIQEQALINQPVKWVKQIKLEKPGKTIVEIPLQAENIVVYKIDSGGNKEKISEQKIKITARASAEINLEKQEESSILAFLKKIFNFLTGKVVGVHESGSSKVISINENAKEYEIKYETPAPYLEEEKTERGKRIKVIGPEDIHYKDVLISAGIEELGVTNPDSIKIYWLEQNLYISPEKIEDKNDNGIYDYLEWIVPELSNQTFEIIVIVKAEHLDSDRNFISDIYEQVKALDDIWSEEISNGEYVRVTFEKKLTSENDITIYPRIILGNPRIEVYEKDKNDLVAEFENIASEEYNQILLTNLQNEQDTFDLKVIGGSVEFDHIVDPYMNITGTAWITQSGTYLVIGEIKYNNIPASSYDTIDVEKSTQEISHWFLLSISLILLIIVVIFFIRYLRKNKTRKKR